MKLKRLLSVLIIAAIALALLPAGALAATTPSSWAKTEVDMANVNGLVTPNISKDFQRDLTREEFCELVVALTEKIVGRELELPSSNPFYDTNSMAVLKAYQYGLRTLGTGIVNGTDVGKFSPDAKVTRQQIAAMMIRAYSQMELDLGRTLLVAPVTTLSFNDASKIQTYAVDPVKSAVANGMFKGDDKNNFNPANNIRAEESVLVVVRSFEQTMNTVNANASTVTILDRCTSNLNIGYAYGDLQTSVTQDIYLPTSLIGGASVSWVSSNPAIISSDGTVNANYNTSVVLTATIWLGNQTRTKSFTLTTSTLTGNSLLLNNARDALEIDFRSATDTLDNVTDDVFLPTTVLGLPVTWQTSNTSVVTTTGRVNVPNDDRTLTATLTGTFYVGSQVGTRTFTITVRNKNYSSPEVYLHNIKLGMTLSEATSALGSQPKRTVSLTSNETWYTYYTTSSSSTNLMQNFVAVAIQSNRVVGVYTMVNGWESYLRDGTKTSAARLTPAEVNRMSGISLTTYSDSRSTNSSYAAFLSDDTSTMLDTRTFTVAQLENLLLDLVNAFRGINSARQITSNSQLLSSARSHSANLTSNDIYNEAGTTSNRTFAARASAAGYTGTVTGMMAYNQTNPFDYLDDLISTNAYRNTIISTSTTAVGIGASTVTSGYYRNIVTAVFGTGVTNYPITNVTSATAISLNINESRNYTLTVAPSNYDESFTVASSNTNVFTVAQSTNPLIVTITGRANGTAYLNVTTNSGRTFQILVTIGTTYASSITIPTASRNILIEAGKTHVITPTLSAGATVTPTYTTNSAAIAAFSNAGAATTTGTSGTVFARAAGNAVITVTAQRSATTTDVVSASANIRVVPAIATTVNIPAGQTTGTVAAAAMAGVAYTYAVVSGNSVTVNSSTGALTVVGTGNTVVSVTATSSGYTNLVRNVTVSAAGGNSVKITASPSTTLAMGNTMTLTAVTTPASSTVTAWSIVSDGGGGDVNISGSGKTVTLTPTAIGTLKVLVLTSDGSTEMIAINVVDVAPTISVSLNTSSIASGGTINATATIGPNQYAIDATQATITWSVTDPAVATLPSAANGLSSIAIDTTASITDSAQVFVLATITYNGLQYTSTPVSFTVTPAP